MQPVILVDAGSGDRATQSDSLVVISINGVPVGEQIKNGTRLGNLTFDDGCSVQGVPYKRYNGTIE